MHVLIVPVVPKVSERLVFVLQMWFFGVCNMNWDIFFLCISWMVHSIEWVRYDVGTEALVVIETSIVRLSTLGLRKSKTA